MLRSIFVDVPSSRDVSAAEFQTVQEAVDAAISQHVPLYLPSGDYDFTDVTTGAARWVAIYGDGDNTVVHGGMRLGPGAIGSGARPSGWLRDLTVEDGLTLDGLRLFCVDNIEVKNAPVGFDFVNNCFGARVTNS